MLTEENIHIFNKLLADPETPKHIRDEILALRSASEMLSKNKLSDFLRAIAFPALEPETDFIPNWHVEYLAYMLQRTINDPNLNPTPDKQIKRLIINVPPRSGKSWIVSGFRAFLLAHKPHEKFIVASNATSLARRLNTDTKRILQSEQFKQLFTPLNFTKDTEDYFSTDKNGEMRATTVGGQIVGQGANYITVDDLLSPDNAESPIERQKANDYFQRNLFSRLNNKHTGVIIVIMQRLNELDLTGFLAQQNKHLDEEFQWQLVKLPAVATETKTYSFYNKSYTFEEGTALQPVREPVKLLEQMKLSMNPIVYAGQYMQEPMPIGGSLIKLESFKRYNNLPSKDEVVYSIHSWDTGIKTAKDNDPSALIKILVTKTNQIYIAHSLKIKKEYNDLRSAIIGEAKNDEYPPNVVLIEDKASGQSLIQDLRRTSNLPIIAINPEKDKFTRFIAETPQVEAGRVHLPQMATWLHDFEHELLMFPNGAHDDQVDAFSQALKWIRLKTRRQFRVAVLDINSSQQQPQNKKNDSEQDNHSNGLTVAHETPYPDLLE